jgi:two-component system, NtrC family, sensor kinase
MAPHPQGSAPVSRERPGVTAGGQGFLEDTLRASNQLLRALTEAQAHVLRGGDPREAFERLLAAVLELTGSPAGVIGEVHRVPGAVRSFQIHARFPREETEDTWTFPLRGGTPAAEPRELRSLVEAVCNTEGPVLAGGPSAEHALLGLPLDSGGAEHLGVVGLAQRPGGYDAGVVDFLQPFVTVCTQLLLGWRHEQRRRRDEQELRQGQEQSTERLRLMMDSVPDGLWDMHVPTGEVVANRAWLGMLGYAEGELEPTYATWAHLGHPEDVPEVQRIIREHFEGRTPFIESAYRVRRKDGGWSWVLTRCRVMARDAQGRPLRMVGTNVDITAQKRTEERLRALVRTLPDMVFRMRADGTFLDYHVNNNEPLVTPLDRIIGNNIRQSGMPASVTDKLLAQTERTIRDGTLELLEYALDMPQGRQHYEARTFRSGPDEALSLVRNITEEKLKEERLLQQEEQLRRHRDSLEELVRNRSEKLLQATIELEEQQAQLIQAEKLASLGQMAAGVAHEINNPVSYVMSNLGTLDQYVSSLSPLLRMQRELLELPETEPGGPRAELLERMRELWQREDMDYILGDAPELIEESLGGTRRIKEIAQSLRSFAREDSGEPQLVDVNAELATSLKIVWNELKYKCEVKRDFGPLPPVSCHPTQIAQVFTNLLMNASQAIETRGEIRIRTRHEGGDVIVEIADTGKGMTQETLSKLFTPFFTTKPRGQGTGLGLSVSYGIITRHKGRIEVQSEPGKGSTFIIRLPAEQR